MSVLDQLVEDSKRNISAMASTVLPRLTLSAADARELVTYIETHPDRSAYHPLLALRRAARAEYDRLPAATKAAVLCAALTHLGNLNDYGYLDPGESHDGEAAQALLELGTAAIPCLARLVDDRRPAPLFGSEDAAMSSTYQYRRCDFAYRYLAQILGFAPRFDPDPRRRDTDIAALKRRLETT